MGDIKLTSLAAILPEFYLAIATMFLLVWGVYRLPRANNFLIGAGVLILAITGWMVAGMAGKPSLSMNGMFLSDRFTAFAKIIVLAGAALSLLLSAGWLKHGQGRPFEFVILLLFATLGMLCMVSANDLITLYMGLEMSSLALYVLASFERDHAKSSEAGLKYFVLGALASGMMLFGMSLVYGFAGTTGFTGLAQLFAGGEAVSRGVTMGLIMIIVGFCFKLSAVPFHMWAPDVYEGAPTPVTAFFATAPKAAAMALFARVLLQPFGELFGQWQQIVIFVSVASMLAGSLAAIMQTNIKRLLAYSSIGHAGFMLMGLAAGSAAGVQALLIYLFVYLFMSAGAFGCVLMMQRNGQPLEDIRELSGLSKTHPLMALVFAVFLFSMAGIPPMAGFFGKLYVVLAAVQAGLVWLAVVGVLTSVIGCYYYLKVVKVMYFDEAARPYDGVVSRGLKAAVALGAMVTLLFFLVPTPLVAQAGEAASAVLAAL